MIKLIFEANYWISHLNLSSGFNNQASAGSMFGTSASQPTSSFAFGSPAAQGSPG